MENSGDYAYYREHAQDVKPEDITSSEKNKGIIQKLRDGDSDLKSLYILEEPMEDDSTEFIVGEEDHLGWLGYFIGEAKTLGSLHIQYDMSLVERICRNRSIHSLYMERDAGDYQSLGNLLKNNTQLDKLTLGDFTIGNVHKLASALRQSSHLKCLRFERITNLSDTGAAVIAEALSAQTQLEELAFEEDDEVGLICCAALETTLMGWGRNSKLKKLEMVYNHIDDEGLQTLLRGVASCRNLVELNLLGNNQITAAGLMPLSDYFQSAHCRLETLIVDRMEMGDEGASILATGLSDYKPLKLLDVSSNDIGDEGIAALVSAITTAANTNLENLNLSYNRFSTAGIRSLSGLISERSTLKILSISNMEIDDDGISIIADALSNNTSILQLFLGGYVGSRVMSESLTSVNTFSRLLCDTSSINNIYLSNHSLRAIGDYHIYESVSQYLYLNHGLNIQGQRDLIPKIKILVHYPDLGNMEPFFRWKLAFLPMITDWFEMASRCRGYFEESREVFQRRELSAMYKFIRGVPMLVADGYWSQQLKRVRLKKRKLEEEEERLLDRLGREKRASSL